jgi:ubiquinone/menaquinone biosynthesis C-methylase UbiE
MNRLRAYFENLAERWDAQQPAGRQEVLRQMLAPFEDVLGAAQAILEVGTGTGALIPCLRECAPHARLVSIDLAHAMLGRARKRQATARLVQADVHRLPLASGPAHRPAGNAGRFDLVVCHNSFPHFAHKEAALCEIMRILSPGGHLFILHDLSREQVNAIHGGAGEPIQNDLLPPGEETRRMLLRAGCIDAQVEDTEDHYVAIGHRDKALQEACVSEEHIR